ncbi:MAG TPA: M20/M25/M40 family metallo-hydrolase [Anaerovoracaceae bacterium]|nr:M20/M25/M40 family metallo-hydrolase [Anaerovoracaceae bacterium]
MKKKIDNYIRENTRNIIKDILELVEIKSVSGNEEENKKALNFFLEKAKNMGFKTMKTSLGDVGVVEFGHGEEKMGILVHVDVVGVGDTEKWTYPPFEGKVAKGFIWGRGVVDDKGPAIMCLYAMKAIKDLQIPINKTIWLIIGTSEESEWSDIENFKKEFEVPDYGFTPDGDFPIYNREMGYCDVILDFKEPCRDMIEYLASGDSANTIPSKAEIKIKNQDKLTFQGIACHSSVPGMGINAISKMAVEQSYRTELNFIRFLNDFLEKDYNGGRLEIDTPANRNNEPSEKTIVVPTVLSLTEEGVRLNVNLRPWFDVSYESVEKAFGKYAKEYNYTFCISDFMKSVAVDEKEEFLQTMSEVYEEYGYKSTFLTAVGTSYAKAMEHFICWGPVLDTQPSCAHMENERLSVENMVIATQMYATFLARDAGAYNQLRKNSKDMSSLEKALYLLDIFTEPPYRYDVPTLVDLTGMNRTTVYRNLTTLEQVKLLDRDEETRSYCLGPMAAKIGKSVENVKERAEQ